VAGDADKQLMALVLKPHLRVSEIAYEVGFASLTPFNRSFRKLTGQSPSRYRKSLRRNNAATGRDRKVAVA
jgi:AraC-like DNA-binding protein